MVIVIFSLGSKRLVIVDLRNNYGGVIQDAMLSASLFLSDPAAVLCHTVSSRAPMGTLSECWNICISI